MESILTVCPMFRPRHVDPAVQSTAGAGALGVWLADRGLLFANIWLAGHSVLENSPSAEAAVVVAGLVEAPHGPQAAEEAMAGAAALQRMKLEKRLVYLGTLGNNAPFVGLLGTVIGIVQAFDELGKAAKAQTTQVASTIAPQTVMTSIAEALVATAIGLLVAIPAVAAYNMFQRLTKSTLANTEVLSRILLAHLKSEPEGQVG